jgi:16S rRNA pseudouridine516 synthase
MAKERLDKVIASMGKYSRREVKALVKEGLVLVDGMPARAADDKVDPELSAITVNGEELGYRRFTYLMLHKPGGILSATEDSRQKTVLDLLTPELQKIGLFPVGRLDKETEGLLLFTDDGRLDAALLSPAAGVEKTYFFRAAGALPPHAAEEILRGIPLTREGTHSAPAVLTVTGRCTLGDLVPHLPPREAALCRRRAEKPATEGTLTVTEGKWHEVRRILGYFGLSVLALYRTEFGPISLGELPAGALRPLTEEETRQLYSRAGIALPES